MGSRGKTPRQALKLKSHRKLGDVACFESPYFFVAQFEVHSRDCISQMLWFSHTNNRRSHSLLLQQPCQTDVRHGNMAFFGNGFHGLDDLMVGFLSLGVECLRKLVGFTPLCVRTPLAS